MARIAGVNIPSEKQIWVSLTYIYGIGRETALSICDKANIDKKRRVSQLSEEEVLKIREIIDANYLVEGDLRREIGMNIKALKDMKCYRGIRHIRNLPARGQRTHTNARTKKGRAVAIAGKKKAAKK